jgi:hypothetical protein
MQMKRLLVAITVFAGVAVATAATAQPWQGWKGGGGWGMQGGYHRMYDPSKVETVTGEVISVEQVTPMRQMGQGIGLKLKTDKGTLFVHLGPQWFIERQDVKIAAGEKVEIKGVRAVQMGQDVFIAGEVRKGDGVLKLRDESGIPAWAGWRRSQQK